MVPAVSGNKLMMIMFGVLLYQSIHRSAQVLIFVPAASLCFPVLVLAWPWQSQAWPRCSQLHQSAPSLDSCTIVKPSNYPAGRYPEMIGIPKPPRAAKELIDLEENVTIYGHPAARVSTTDCFHLHLRSCTSPFAFASG